MLTCSSCGHPIKGSSVSALGLLAEGAVKVKCRACRGEVPEAAPVVMTDRARATAMLGGVHPMAYGGPAMRRAREELREAERAAEAAAGVSSNDSSTHERTREEGQQTMPAQNTPEIAEWGLAAAWAKVAAERGLDLAEIVKGSLTQPTRLQAAEHVMAALGVDRPSGYNRTTYLSACLKHLKLAPPPAWAEAYREAMRQQMAARRPALEAAKAAKKAGGNGEGAAALKQGGKAGGSKAGIAATPDLRLPTVPDPEALTKDGPRVGSKVSWAAQCARQVGRGVWPSDGVTQCDFCRRPLLEFKDGKRPDQCHLPHYGECGFFDPAWKGNGDRETRPAANPAPDVTAPPQPLFPEVVTSDRTEAGGIAGSNDDVAQLAEEQLRNYPPDHAVRGRLAAKLAPHIGEEAAERLRQGIIAGEFGDLPPAGSPGPASTDSKPYPMSLAQVVQLGEDDLRREQVRHWWQLAAAALAGVVVGVVVGRGRGGR